MQWSSAQVEKHLRQSQQVFLGHVFITTTTTFQVKVVDVFKGTINRRVLTGTAAHSSCALPIEEGLWVFYTNLKADENIPTLDACSFSGNLTQPAVELTPPSPRLSSPVDSVARRHFMEQQRAQQQALFTKNWLNEYAILTAYRKEVESQRSPPLVLYMAFSALVISLIALLIAIFKK